MWRKEVKKCSSFRMCLNFYDYQPKASRYRYGLTYMKTRVSTNQKHTLTKNKKKGTQA